MDEWHRCRMPAEWERHESTWISWPKNPLTFSAEIIGDVERAYVTIVEELSRGERVDILVDDGAGERRVSDMLSGTGRVAFHRIRSADVWVRDYGPIFVRQGAGISATKWIFNAWGNKYDDLLPDNEAGKALAAATGLKVIEEDMVLEGGSIDVNGSGLLMTTEQCLMNSNRNPKLSRAQIASKLSGRLGAEQIIWLKSGIEGDDTDGHIDDIARFVSKNTVVCMIEEDEHDGNFSQLNENLKLLRAVETASGGKLDVVTLPMPGRLEDGGRLPASYANFYIGNAVVLVPVFGDRHDDAVLDTLKTLFPGRKIAGIDCRALVHGLGTIHCATQQQPAP